MGISNDTNWHFTKQNKLFYKRFIQHNDKRKSNFSEDKLVNILSPGRINIIGEHTDHNSGLVIPAAINKYKFFTAICNYSDNIEIYDNLYNEYYS